jgi:hypothetical protein
VARSRWQLDRGPRNHRNSDGHRGRRPCDPPGPPRAAQRVAVSPREANSEPPGVHPQSPLDDC